MDVKEKFKIFCIGSNLESYECLSYLISKNCSIDTLITLPSGHSEHVSDYYDLHDFCKTHGITVIDTTNVNSEETLAAVQENRPHYLFTLGWSQIFRKEFIACFSEFIVGTHPSKLPHGRGRAPLPWTIIEDLGESAVSFFKIDTGVDTGKLIFQRTFKIPPRTYVKELYATVAKELGYGFYEIYKSIVNNKTITYSTQNEEGVTIRGKRTPSDGFIDFSRTLDEVEKLIRAVSEPYPGAYCYYKDNKITFWKVGFDTEGKYSGTLGQILRKSEIGILVQFSDGNLWLNKPTDENGAPLPMKFFRIGDKLGYNVQDEMYKIKKSLK